MESINFETLLLLFMLAMAAVGVGVIMNAIEKRIKIIINNCRERRVSRIRVLYNLKFINKKMK